jgi:SAM-dependent methyltransferase
MTDLSEDVRAIGGRALEMFSSTPQLNDWMLSKFGDRARGQVLEVGSGIGNMTRILVERATHVVATDVDDAHIEVLERDFGGDPRVTVSRFDLSRPAPAAVAERRYDAIVAINVIEHVEDDVAAVSQLASLLAPGGQLLVYVPALPLLFGTVDQALGHYRRYTRPTLERTLRAAGLEPEPPRYMNLLGTAGWFLQGRVLRRRLLDARQVRLFERLVPILRREDFFRLPFGLGLTTTARRAD